MAESLGEVYGRLAAAQKGRARSAPGYSVYVNRPVGRVFATLAYRWGASPDQVTVTSAICTFAAAVIVATVPISPWLGVLVWFLLAVGYALDSADGQVARLRGGGSLAGEWLDHFVDAVKSIALHLAVAIGLYRFAGFDAVVILIPLAFALVSGVTFFGMILNDLLKGKKGVPSSTAVGGSTPLRALLMLPVDYGFLCLIFVLWGLPQVFVIAYGLVLVASTLFLGAAAVKWHRDMSRLDRELGS